MQPHTNEGAIAPAGEAQTPQQIVAALDAHIVGQKAAKRAVALALRNRWRRKQVQNPLRDEIAPKNIILIGSTGVGKTEIARRMAKLARAPFLKVEASKFTEVGYVGRDVESIVRDLTEAAIHLARSEAMQKVAQKADALAEERLVDALLGKDEATPGAGGAPDAGGQKAAQSRAQMAALLQSGKLAGREVDVELDARRSGPPLQLMGGATLDDLQGAGGLQEWMGQLGREMLGRKKRTRRVGLDEARKIFAQQEAHKLIDEQAVIDEGVRRAEQDGVVFLDEIDKIARRGSAGGSGPDVSREGVQRDILPIVEGCTVQTKHGPVKTDHVLFVAAGAFHVSKVSDLIPELQGRFPIRVALDALGEQELRRILQEPQHALPVQYAALLAADNVALKFAEDGLTEVAKVAARANARGENIGARRLHTVLEKVLEQVSFAAPESAQGEYVVDAAFVREALGELPEQEDLARYIL